MPLVRLSKHGDVLVLTIDNPPVNALSPGVPEALVEGVQAAAADTEVRAVVVIGAGRTYIAGADIRQFAKVTSGEQPWVSLLPPLLAIENCPKPVVMAIHGTAFGGGLETAMAGHYRVAVPDAQVGQPEVKLGIIPGAGGTQRLPRLAGVAKALEMCTLGEPVGAREALAAGIVDRIIEGDLLAGAIAFAGEVAGRPPVKTRERNEKLAATPEIFTVAGERARAARPGENAPLAALEAIAAAARLPFDEGCRFEEDLFLKCMFSSQSQAMIYVFFGERDVKKRQVDLDAIAARLREEPEAAWASEADRLMAENPALQPLDIDLACVLKLGFPAWRGGPLFARSRDNGQ